MFSKVTWKLVPSAEIADGKAITEHEGSVHMMISTELAKLPIAFVEPLTVAVQVFLTEV
jgi:hypothetical protein